MYRKRERERERERERDRYPCGTAAALDSPADGRCPAVRRAALRTATTLDSPAEGRLSAQPCGQPLPTLTLR